MALKQHTDHLVFSISPKVMFPDLPTIRFEPSIDTCPDCKQMLGVAKSRTKTVATLAIGMFRAHEIIRGCKKCENRSTYSSEELLKLIPYRCKFGYDILVYVGTSMFLRCRNEREIRLELEQKNVSLSPSEIAYLAKKFIAYLALAHRESRERIRNFMNLQGGYVLHLDATCEGEEPHLMSGLDGITEIVLENIKLSSEKAEKIIPFLRNMKKLYGNPRALVHDMGAGILGAVREVFPDIPDYICHFHFLRDIGKDLFGKENDRIRARLRKHGIQGVLRRRAREFKKIVDRNPALVESFGASLKMKRMQDDILDRIPVVAAYSLVLWALEGKNEGQGYGFPFDRVHLAFYQRLQTVDATLRQLNETKLRNDRRDNKPYVKILRDLYTTMSDAVLAKTAIKMREKIVVFDKLRDAMRIALPDGNAGLNDNGDQTDIHTIEGRVKHFHHWLSHNESFSTKDDYKKMIAQIEKYWDKLFADPIIVDTPDGKVTIHPQRTNNVLERFFRDLKRGYRRRSGTNSLSRALKAMLADTPLVKNLQAEHYMKIILDGKSSLEERFAEIDAHIVRQELLKLKSDMEIISPKVKRLVKNPEFLEDLTSLFSR